MLGPQRYSRVPWLDATDLEAVGDPETTVELPHEITHGLVIVRPFGKDTDAMLLVHAMRETGAITLAITDEIAIDHQPVKPKYWWHEQDGRQVGGPRSQRQQADGHKDNED